MTHIWRYRDYILLSLLFFLAQPWQMLLRYERAAILQGEYWRYWTGHLTHSNLEHLVMNLVGVWIWLLFQPKLLTGWSFWGWIIFIGTGISGLFWFFLPQLDWYVGFSGILYGLFVLTALELLITRQDIFTALALLVFLGGKTAFDMFSTHPSLSAELIGVPVVYQAHLFGMLLACILTGIQYLYRHYQTRCTTG